MLKSDESKMSLLVDEMKRRLLKVYKLVIDKFYLLEGLSEEFIVWFKSRLDLGNYLLP